MEDFAQVFGLYPRDKYHHRSYANIASVLWAETGEAGTFEFFRRLVFSVLIGNGDMHLKNWSLLYPDGRTPVLSPAYDLVATFPYIPNDNLALTFGGSRSLSAISRDQVRRFADTARLPVNPLWTIVRETVERTVVAWGNLAGTNAQSRGRSDSHRRQEYWLTSQRVTGDSATACWRHRLKRPRH
jgi:serine/threonine-protein kinase HipA